MNSNPTLDLNLEAIARYNPKLKEEILSINELKNSIELCTTSANEPNWMFNGTVLHNQINAELEAKEVFSRVKNDNLSVHVIYGFGLGYLPSIFAEKSKGTILIYEPNIEILAATLEIANVADILSKPNVFVYTDISKFLNKYSSILLTDSQTSVSYLQSYKVLYKNELNEFANLLNLRMGQMLIDNNYVKIRLVPAVKIVCQNLDKLVNEPVLMQFENIYKDKTALVVSAGPSLDKNIDVIKKYRNNAIIISVGQALRTLVNNGINPDFLAMIEQYNTSSQIEGIDLSDVDFIIEPFSNPVFHNWKVKNKISYPSYTSIANNIWTKIANIDSSNYVSSGTVSFTSLYSAKILGFKDIVLVGQDLAFCSGKCYSKDSKQNGLIYKQNPETGKVEVMAEDIKAYTNSLFSQVDDGRTYEQKEKTAKSRIDEINRTLYYVEGVNGLQVPTTAGYASFISQFENFAKEFGNEINLFNTSTEGALIKGFKNINLEDILREKHPVQRIDLKYTLKYDKVEIRNNINSEIKTIDNVIKMIENAGVFIEKYDKAYSNRKVLTEDCVKYFRQVLALYIEITETYCPISMIFMYLQKYLGMEVSTKLRKNKQIDSNAILEVYEALKNYFLTVQADLREVRKILSEKVEKYGEMLNTKS